MRRTLPARPLPPAAFVPVPAPVPALALVLAPVLAPVFALVLALVLVLAPGARAEKAPPLLHLRDGRVLHGRAVASRRKQKVLKTDFGALVVPESALAGGTAAPPPRRRETERATRTRWLEIRHDLSGERAQLYADQLDAFFAWMIRVYGLDEKRVRRGAPYRLRVFRRRGDFKKLQAEIAPGIEGKGKAFAEGVAGFYAPDRGRIYLWDAEGSYGGVHLEVAKHETTHLLDDLMARQTGIRLPTWFEEGAATYFSMYVALGGRGGQEPEDHPGAAAQVLGDLDAGKAMESRTLRGVKWAEFRGREYAWGWAHVRFLRQHERGRLWKPLLQYLRTVSPAGPVTDSEERRFLKAARFKSSAAFDDAWHRHLAAARPVEERALVGTSPEVLGRVAAIEKPAARLARNFARIGLSLARVRAAAAAVVYLRAALRGGVEDPEVPFRLAEALARQADLAMDEPWPDEALGALRTASRLAPLRAIYRRLVGRQLLLRGEVEAAYKTLGLALVLLSPDDDDVAVALDLLRAAAAMYPDRPLEQTVARLAESVPPAAAALNTSLLYYLQETEDWERLGEILARRVKEKRATVAERAALAGLYKASDRLEEADELYAGILAEDPSALRYWADRVECLARLGRTADARAARARALQALRKDPRNLGWLRRRLERIRLGEG